MIFASTKAPDSDQVDTLQFVMTHYPKQTRLNKNDNIRSEDALIFEFCSLGNLEGLKSLLRRGDASPLDCDPEGWTLSAVNVAVQEKV